MILTKAHLGALGVGCCYAVLAVVVGVSGTRPQLAIILSISAVLALVLAWLGSFLGGLSIPPIDTGSQLILVAWASIYVQLLVRLLAFENFDGNPSNFDFGVSCSAGVCSRNASFNFEFNSFGHCMQGCLAFLLFPAVRAAVWRGVASMSCCRPRRAIICFDILGLGVVVYPIYNTIKRIGLHLTTFANSSFCNNGAEWASGAMFGVGAGLCVEAWAKRHQQQVSPSGSDVELPRFEVIEKMRLGGGVTIVLASFAAGLMFGVTWENIAHRHSKDAADAGATIGMLAIPTAILLIWHLLTSNSPHWARATDGDSAKAVQLI